MGNTLPQLHAGMGAAVLKHLSRFAPLDGLLQRYEGAQEGFIAGQAVASALSELFFDGRCVAYNDVDVFLMSERFERPTNQALTTLDFEAVNLSTHYRQLVVELTTVYEVCRTRRQGMLNEVLCRPMVAFDKHPALAAQQFLRSFDLNCVQVGVRLSDGALVWTPAFAHFLATRQMLVVNVKTPVHTAIRWFRKKAELEGIYGHDDHAMELLAAVRARVAGKLEIAGSSSYQRMLTAQSQFGSVYADKARAVMARLQGYFELKSVPHEHVSLYTLTPRGQLNEELVAADTFDASLPTYARALQGHWKRHVCEQLLDQFRAPDRKRGALRMNVQVEGVDAILALSSPRDARRLDKAVAEHPSLLRCMLCMSTRQQLALVAALEAVAAEQGLWVYGVFEQLEHDAVYDLSLAPVNEMHPKVLEVLARQHQALEEALANRKKPLVAILPPLELEGFRIEELTSFKELAQESARLHHCVAGYWRGVVTDRCRIIRLSKPRVQDSLTMELVPRKGGGWVNAQLRGLHNRDHSSAEWEVAERYVDMLNVRALAARVGVPVPVPLLLALTQVAPKVVRWLRKQLPGQTRHYKRPLPDRLRKFQHRVVRWFGADLLQAAVLQGMRHPSWGYLNWPAYRGILKEILRARLRVLAGAATLSEAAAGLAQAMAQRQKAIAGYDQMDDDIAF